MPIYIDIETSQSEPEPWMIPDVAAMEPPGNMSKAETIAKWRAEKAETIVDEIREQSSLHTILGGVIVCVGIAVDDKPVTVLDNPTLDEAGELAMLKKLELGLARYPSDPLVAYNGASYDFVWLRHRALRHGLFALARRCWQAKPWERGCIDPYLLWGKGLRGKLPEVARFVGVQVEPGISGKDVQGLLDAGDLVAVAAHCRSDVELLRDVFRAFAAAGWVEGEDPDAYAPLAPAAPRRTLRQQVGDAMVDLGAALVQDAATASGVEWRTGVEVGEAGPLLEGLPAATLRRFLAELRSRRVAA